MRKDKPLAVALRRKGYSYKAIEEKLGIRRSTLAGWFAHFPWSKAMQKQLIQRMRPVWRKNMQKIGRKRANEWRERRKCAREEAENSFPKFAKEPLFIAGLMLYWGEGDSNLKNGHTKITNTSPKMIAIFSRFLQKYCQLSKEKIRLDLILYPDLNDQRCKEYWSQETKIPLSQFNKTQFITGKQGKRPTKRLMYGIGMLHGGGCELKEKVIQWIALYQKELLR